MSNDKIAGGIYLGDDPADDPDNVGTATSFSTAFSDQGSQPQQGSKTRDTFEQFFPLLSGTISGSDQFTIPPSYQSPQNLMDTQQPLGKTKPLFDDHGIYLGL